MASGAVNPKPFLHSLLGEDVMVKQKFTKNEYSGKLVSVDAYFNLQLKNCKEHRYDDLGFIDVVTLGDALIRCNSVVFICPKPSWMEQQEVGY